MELVEKVGSLALGMNDRCLMMWMDGSKVGRSPEVITNIRLTPTANRRTAATANSSSPKDRYRISWLPSLVSATETPARAQRSWAATIGSVSLIQVKTTSIASYL